ncbi:MAG: HAD family hydrolase [Tepidisphaeraceae bacterium]
MMALGGVIFDLDGTLVDTNALHVEAWRRSFESLAYRVNPDRIWQEVGKGGDQLVPAILGNEAEAHDGAALREGWTKAYLSIVTEHRVRVFPRVTELIDAIKQRGLRTVLATSSAKKVVRATLRSAGLDVGPMMDAMTDAGDIEQTKPKPDLVLAAAKKVGLSPAQLAMVGDSPYDALACRDAGVVCLGLTCGGFDGQRLVGNGARAVWRDPAELLDRLDEALRVASPGRTRLTRATLDSLMHEALSAAEEALNAGEAPIGCALFRGDGTLLARGHNELNRTGNKTAHAETVTFAKAAGKSSPDCRDLLLVSTLEPCVMCTGAAMEAAVDAIVYGLRAPADSGTRRVNPPQSPESQMPRIVGNVLAKESRRLFERFLTLSPNPRQAKYVRQLLELSDDPVATMT